MWRVLPTTQNTQKGKTVLFLVLFLVLAYCLLTLVPSFSFAPTRWTGRFAAVCTDSWTMTATHFCSVSLCLVFQLELLWVAAPHKVGLGINTVLLHLALNPSSNPGPFLVLWAHSSSEHLVPSICSCSDNLSLTLPYLNTKHDVGQVKLSAHV